MDIKNLVLFILNNCKPNMGVKKLNKLAFLLEFTYIFDHFNGNFSKNKQLTKTEFVALPMGPVIQDYKKLFQEMKTEKLIVQNTKADVGKIDYLPLVNIDSEIDENKKNFLLRVLDKYKNLSAAQLQTYTHSLDSYGITISENDNRPGKIIDKELAHLDAILSLDNLMDD